MKNIKKDLISRPESEKSRLAGHIAGLPKSGIRRFFELVNTMDDVISLGVGEPDFTTPWAIRESGIYSLERGHTSYTSNLGASPLRKAICNYVAENYGVSYDPANECLVSVGVSEALDLAFRALLSPGDEVIYTEPCYVSYPAEIAMAHGVPVPITTRNFKNPRRDMAITGAAGPISNLILAIINLIVLRLFMIFISHQYIGEAYEFALTFSEGGFTGTLGFTMCALLAYLLYLGVVMNVMLAIFNLIPVPPFDGSRIFYVFLPTKWYFAVMRYERYIMMGFFVLLAFGFLSVPLSIAGNFITGGLMSLAGMGDNTEAGSMLCTLEEYVYLLLKLN